MNHLVINARFLSQPITGVQRFAIEVSKALAKSGIETSFLCPKNILHEDVAIELNAEKCGTLSGTAWEQIDLPRILNKRNNPTLLNLANTGPLQYRNQMLVLHDLAFFTHPEWFSKKFTLWYHFLIPILVKRATTLFTVSEFSKKEISNFWPELQERICVVGNGLPTLSVKSDTVQKVAEKPYILCVSGDNKRKNTDSVIEAMKYVNDAGLRLLVLGRTSEHFSDRSQKEQAPSFSSRVEFLEDVSDSRLASLYLNAEALVYPSSYEGFGLPPLEALSFDCPSVLTDIPVFREIYEGAAVFIQDAKPENIAKGIKRIRSEQGLREQLVLNGKKLLEKHTFKKVSERIIQQLLTSDDGLKNSPV